MVNDFIHVFLCALLLSLNLCCVTSELDLVLQHHI